MSQACINYNRNPLIKAGIGGVDSSLLPGNLLPGLNDSHGIPGGPLITPGFPISVDGILNKSDGTSEPKEAPGSQDGISGTSGSVETTSTKSNLANGTPIFFRGGSFWAPESPLELCVADEAGCCKIGFACLNC